MENEIIIKSEFERSLTASVESDEQTIDNTTVVVAGNPDSARNATILFSLKKQRSPLYFSKPEERK